MQKDRKAVHKKVMELNKIYNEDCLVGMDKDEIINTKDLNFVIAK